MINNIQDLGGGATLVGPCAIRRFYQRIVPARDSPTDSDAIPQYKAIWEPVRFDVRYIDR